MSVKVDEYIRASKSWQQELKVLRRIVTDCGLIEDFKWRAPCYTFQKSNVAILGALKDCCSLSFFKGALLKDPHGILEKPGENSRAARVIRFKNVQEIFEIEPALKACIHDAIEVEKAGLKVDFQENTKLAVPEELQHKFDECPALQAAFDQLTPGRQRGYLLYFSAPKQARTRESRVEKYMQQILDGKGLNDCTCGLSKKLPQCDGSHKSIR